MADEDALFAEFMGEIKSTVVEPSGPSTEKKDGGISDTASVGDVENERGADDGDTTKRKVATEAISAPAVKKPRYMGKLVAAALPMKAGAAAAGGVASKPAVSNKTLAKNGGTPSVLPATAKGANGISSAAAIVDKEGNKSPIPGKSSNASDSSKGARQAVDTKGKGVAGGHEAGGGGGVAPEGKRGVGAGAVRNTGAAPEGGNGTAMGMQGQFTVGGQTGVHPSQGGMAGAGVGMNMGMMGSGGARGGVYSGGYGMPAMGMNMGMGMPPGMSMPPGMGQGPYPDGMGYGYGGQMNGALPGVGMGMGAMGGAVPGTVEAAAAAAAAADTGGKAEKVAKAKAASSNKFKRVAGGKSWEDETLAEWPENDYRLFVGDLGNEVTDDNLAGAFRKYASFAKARIIREKWNKKSKGYGFVSFLDGMDMLKALREQNGKYLGNRPMKISKSSWKDRDVKEVKKKNKRAKKVKKALGLL